jgi:hypothetical protein
VVQIELYSFGKNLSRDTIKRGETMKPLPAPNVPGKTESERFDNALRHVFTVSKDDLLKREAAEKKSRTRKKHMTEQKKHK